MDIKGFGGHLKIGGIVGYGRNGRRGGHGKDRGQRLHGGYGSDEYH